MTRVASRRTRADAESRSGGMSPEASTLTPEMRLLVCCARRELPAAERARLHELVRSGVDWSRLAKVAGQHKMLPLAWWHLRAERTELPRATAIALEGAFVTNMGYMLRLSAELLQLNELFASHGVTMVPYKGPALGAQVYGNLALRQAGDLDLVVRRADVSRARALLLARGYQPRHALSRGGAEFMSRSRYGQEFDHPQGISVELHWAFTNGDVALSLALEDLAPRLGTVQIGGGSVAAFGVDDLLLLLCVHGCKHRWDCLEWICGVAEVIRSGSEIDWETLVARAGALGVRRMLLLGVLLARELLDAPVPESILRLARSDGVVPRLAATVPALLCSNGVTSEAAGTLSSDLFRLQLRERARDRVRFLWYRMTTPSRPESWLAVPVGKHWVPVHGFVRPFRVAVKMCSALRRGDRVARMRA